MPFLIAAMTSFSSSARMAFAGLSAAITVGRANNAVVTPSFVVQALCDPVECGPQLGMPNWLCPDGVNFAGPTGRCLLHPEFDVCGWEIASCPDDEPF